MSREMRSAWATRVGRARWRLGKRSIGLLSRSLAGACPTPVAPWLAVTTWEQREPGGNRETQAGWSASDRLRWQACGMTEFLGYAIAVIPLLGIFYGDLLRGF